MEWGEGDADTEIGTIMGASGVEGVRPNALLR